MNRNVPWQSEWNIRFVTRERKLAWYYFYILLSDTRSCVRVKFINIIYYTQFYTFCFVYLGADFIYKSSQCLSLGLQLLLAKFLQNRCSGLAIHILHIHRNTRVYNICRNLFLTYIRYLITCFWYTFSSGNCIILLDYILWRSEWLVLFNP